MAERQMRTAAASQAQSVEHRKVIFAHEAVHDEPTPALLHVVELEPRGNVRLSGDRDLGYVHRSVVNTRPSGR